MKKRLLAALLSVLCLSLCACSKNESKKESDAEVTLSHSQEEETLPSPSPTPSHFPSQSSPPQHSPLYVPDYSTEEVFDYFEEVVLSIEYDNGTGDASLVQKWEAPIYYRIYGAPTETDLEVLESLFPKLNEIEGFPGIYAAEEGQENLTISFLDHETFYSEFSGILQGEDAFGGVEFWYYTDTNEIHTARVGYRTDLDQDTRNSVLIEEIVNMLGVSDTVLREDSIVYQYSNENTELSDVDWLILKLLYNPRIMCGSDVSACRESVWELYY